MHTTLPKHFKLTATCASLALGITVQAQAQTSAPRPDAGSTLQQQRTQPQAAPRSPNEVLPSGFAPKAQISTLPSASISVKSFKFSGNQAISSSELAAVVADRAGKTATLAELNAAAAKVRDLYRQRGYFVAQAYLPRQDVSSGVIEITILEGYVGQAKVTKPSGQAASRLKPQVAQNILDANLPKGTAITQAMIEKPILLLNDLPGVTAKASLSPGQAIGTADVEVEIGNELLMAAQSSYLPLVRATEGLISASVDADNFGSSSVGSERIAVNLAVNSLTGMGDQFTLRAQVAPSNSKSNLLRIGWQTPVGSLGTKFGVSWTQLNYKLIKNFAALQADGDVSVLSGVLTHPFVRSKDFNLTMQAGVDQKRLEDRILSISSTETRKINLAKIGFQSDWRDSLASGGINSLNFGLSQGKLKIEQAAAVATDQAALGAKTLGSFQKTNIDYLRLQNISRDFSVLATASAQFASRNLASAEKMSLGGANAGANVRAYPTGEASGDEGYVGSLEARYINPAWAVGGGVTTVSAFYDFGGITISKNPLPGTSNTRTLKGVGISLALVKEADFSIRATAAWRAGKEKPLSDTDKRPRFWLQASKSF